MRTPDYLYIRNFRPDRWPAGAPQKYDKPPRGDQPGTLGPPHGGYHDIDACPTLDFLIAGREADGISAYFHLAVDRRPQEELFDIRNDLGCLENLADDPAHTATLESLRDTCNAYLVDSGDPRAMTDSDIAETYRRYSSIRSFPAPDVVEEAQQQLAGEGWQELFNGRDLDGWKLAGPENSFEVVNGMIKAQATADQAHLFYVGDVAGADFTDFELMIDCLTTPGSNGGLYFHTSYQDSGFPNDGHEVQVNTSHRNRTRTGSLFAVVNLEESTVPDNDFYTQHIIVRGNQVTIKVNGDTLVDYTEPAGYSHPTYTGRNIDHGTFALQAHDPDSLVYYRNIRVRPLPTVDAK